MAYPSQDASAIPAVTSPAIPDLSEEVHVIEVSAVTCQPTSIVSEDIGLDRAVYHSTTADFWQDGTIDPQYFDAVMWDQNVGGLPGSANAAYLYGHHAQNGDAAFNALDNTKVGDTFTLTGDGCELILVVEAIEQIAKDQLGSEDSLYMRAFDQPGRVVLTTCDPSEGTYEAEDGQRHARNNLVVVLAPTASAG